MIVIRKKESLYQLKNTNTLRNFKCLKSLKIGIVFELKYIIYKFK